MQRLPDWPERLAAFIDARRAVPFSWASNDCCLFAADEVLHITGQDLAGWARGAYNSAESALMVLRERGGVQAIVEQLLPRHEHVLQARRGDVVCVELDGRSTLGVVAGNGCWCGPGETGLLFRPMSEVQLAYAVG
jgi:hypothetical protein